MKIIKIIIVCFALSIVIVSNSRPMLGESLISPHDVYNQVMHIRKELETIRRFIGKPKDARGEIDVNNASPREVYFQAVTLLNKANRLHYDFLRTMSEPVVVKYADLFPADVYGLVSSALIKIREIKFKLDVEEVYTLPEQGVIKEPTDVLRSIVQANRQLNILLDIPYTPNDVFQKVVVAINNASLLTGAGIPDLPEFECCKKPRDVHQRLFKCFKVIEDIFRIKGLKMLTLSINEDEFMNTVPGDVYDLATMINSELAELNHVSGNKLAHLEQYAGRKFPSHVYQQAGILETLLLDLLKQSQMK